MEFQKTEFKTVAEIKKFLEMNKTDTANYYYNLMKDDIKIIGDKQDVYYFDKNSKLWLCKTKEVYNGYIADYLNDVGKSLIKSYRKIIKNSDNYDIKENAKLMKDIDKRCGEFDQTAYINDIINRSTGKLQDNQFVTKLNSNADHLPIKNGKKIDLTTGEITDRTRNDYFSFECQVELTKETKHADKFFKQVMPNEENREYLRKILGYSLTGNMDARCFFIWYGDGSNGKSVIMKLLKCILRQSYHQCSKGIFMKGSQEKVDGPSPDKIALIGVRCATYSEGETADAIDINESFLKMVSGKDEINARALFRAPLTFFPFCKLNLLTNYKPDLNGDKSMKERLRYIFLDSSFVDNPDKNKPNEFKRDDDFVDSLCEEYLSEVFTWIVKGSIEYYKTRSIIPPKEFQDRTNEFFNLQDSVTSFTDQKIEITDNSKDYVKRGMLFELYQDYCTKNSQRCKPRSTLFKRLDDLKIGVRKINGYDVYFGIKIKEKHNEEIDDDDEYDHGIEKIDYSVKVTTKQQIEELEKTEERIKKMESEIKMLHEFVEIQRSFNETQQLRNEQKKLFDEISKQYDSLKKEIIKPKKQLIEEDDDVLPEIEINKSIFDKPTLKKEGDIYVNPKTNKKYEVVEDVQLAFDDKYNMFSNVMNDFNM